MSAREICKQSQFFSCCRGTAAVEFAIILPFMLLLIFGIIEVGRMLTDYQTITKSVRDASRFLGRVEMTCPGTAPSSGPVQNYLVDTNNEMVAKNLVLAGTVDTPTASNFLINLKGWPDYATAAASVAATVNCVANAGQYKGVFDNQALIPVVTVTATVPFNFLWGSLFINTATISMVISHSQVNVGE